MSVAAIEAGARGLLAILDDELTPIVESGAGGVDQTVWRQALTGIARELLSRPGKLFRARLVEQSYALAGGNGGALPHSLPMLVELLHAGSLIVDDIQDDSATRRGGPAMHVEFGMPLALNTGNWLYFAAFEVAKRVGFDDRRTLSIYQLLSECLFRCHQGQALDLAIDVSTVRQRDLRALADTATLLKTGALVGLSAELGAIAADASASHQQALREFGTSLGVGLQRLDDLSGLLTEKRADKGLEDLASGRLTWVWGDLAENLDEIHFAGLQSRLRRARSERGGARRASLEAIATEMRGLISEESRTRVSDALRTAIGRLADAFRNHPALEIIAAEVRRLESSYVK